MALFSKKPDKTPDPPPNAPRPSVAADPLPPQQQMQSSPAQPPAVAPGGGLMSLGEIVSLMLRSNQFRSLPLGAVGALLEPAFASGQFMVVRVANEAGVQAPVGACLWARVSADVDARLAQNLDKPMQLAPAEWKSGDIVWIVAALGDKRVVEPMLRQLQKNMLDGRTLKLRTRGADGASAVRALTPDSNFEAALN